jgi:serine protease Do
MFIESLTSKMTWWIPARLAARHKSFATSLSAMLFACACLGLWPNWVGAAEVTAETAPKPPGFADIVAKVRPAVIAVTVRIEDAAQSSNADEQEASPQSHPFSQNSPLYHYFFGGPEQQQQRPPPARGVELALGSGFFISPDGYAVTNDHVVQHGVSFKVAAEDGKTYTARVIGADLRTDLALLKVDGRSDFPYVRFADREPRIGDWVIAVGNPYGLGGTVTAGIVSARGRHISADTYDDFIQIDAPINKGNSGGPSFDAEGEVIGVNTAILSPSGGSAGIGFAIPSTTANAVIPQLRQKGVVIRGSLGIEIQPVTPEIAGALGLKRVEGVLVAEPQPGGPAAKAGLVPGDVITSVNDQPIQNAHDLAVKIGGTAPGTSVEVGVNHEGNQRTLPITLGELPVTPFKAAVTPPQQETSGLGLGLAPAATIEGPGGKGVIITEIDPDGRAAEKGFAVGDIILDISGIPINTSADVHNAISRAQSSGKHDVLIRVKTRNDRFLFVSVPIAASHQTLWGRIRSWIHSL